jgi:two-component system cell cycle sensor histidine kinase/response regulator CckA
MVAKGDLRQKIEIRSNDEIGELSRSFNQMVGDLKELNESRERGAEALRSAKEYTDNIIGSMTDMLVVVSPDGSIISVNEATARLLGYSEQELIGKPVRSLFAAAEDPTVEEQAVTVPHVLSPWGFSLKRKVLDSLVSDGHFNNSEQSLLASNGATIPALLSGALMWDERGEIRGIVCVARDITERKQAEKALRDSEIRSRTLLDGSPVCNKIIDLDSRLLYMSAAGITRLKIDNIESLYGCVYPSKMYPDRLRTPLVEHLERAKAGEICSVECPLNDTEGNEVWFHTTFVPARDDEGQILYIIASSVDITERKQAEEETRNLQAQLRHAQKMDAIGQLATGVAHEFNNVLVGIRGNAELLLNLSGDCFADDIKRPLKDIERSAVRAYEVTQQLLSFARKKKQNVAVFDVNRIVADSNRMLQRLIGTKITLITQLSADPVLVRADQSEVEQTLMNLVINARDAMPDGGELRIQTRINDLEQDAVPQHCTAGRFVQLSVADNGCGMSPETVERIFEPFFTTKSVGKGTGLGLSAVYSDIVNSDGFVAVESDAGSGTVVDVHLPVSRPAVVGTITETRSPSQESTGGGETILVCDDEEIVLASVSALLKSVGYSVIAANSPQKALTAAETDADAISLLITDLTMPEMDGVELGKQIRQRHPHIKLMYTSGYAADYVENCSEQDGVQIHEKGRPSDEMFRRIRAVLDNEEALGTEALATEALVTEALVTEALVTEALREAG